MKTMKDVFECVKDKVDNCSHWDWDGYDSKPITPSLWIIALEILYKTPWSIKFANIAPIDDGVQIEWNWDNDLQGLEIELRDNVWEWTYLVKEDKDTWTEKSDFINPQSVDEIVRIVNQFVPRE